MKGECTYCEDSGQKNNYLRHNIFEAFIFILIILREKRHPNQKVRRDPLVHDSTFQILVKIAKP